MIYISLNVLAEPARGPTYNKVNTTRQSRIRFYQHFGMFSDWLFLTAFIMQKNCFLFKKTHKN